MESDLNRALVLALAEKGQEWVTADTIRVCRQLQASSSDEVAMCFRDDCFDRNLSIPELRGKSYVSFVVIPDGDDARNALSDVDDLSGDTVLWKSGAARNSDVSIAFRGNASCSFATVLGCSDQKMPAAFALMALAWGMLSLFYMRRQRGLEAVNSDLRSLGSMSYDRSAKVFMVQTITEYDLLRCSSLLWKCFSMLKVTPFLRLKYVMLFGRERTMQAKLCTH